MSSLTVVSGKLKKYNAERETFRAAIKKAFKSMDSDRTGRIFRRDIAVVVDAVFDAIELELAEYGLQLTRPTHEQMEDYVAVAGKLNRAQVTEKELFKFYCQVSSIKVSVDYQWLSLGGEVPSFDLSERNHPEICDQNGLCNNGVIWIKETCTLYTYCS